MILHNINYSTNKNIKNCKLNSYNILYILFCIININLYSQSNFNTIIKPYKLEQQQKIDTLLKISEYKNSKSWLNLLPNVAYNYNAITNSNYITVGVRLNSFANYYQQKNRNQIERLKLKLSLETRLENNLLRLENEFLKINSNLQLIKQQIEDFKLQNELYFLRKDQYSNNKINLENWLKIQQTHTQLLSNINQKINNLKLKITVFQNKIKSPTNLAELHILLDLSKKLKSFSHEQRYNTKSSNK